MKFIRLVERLIYLISDEMTTCVRDYLKGTSQHYYIEDICFFEVNTKYISSSELKTSEFSRVRSTSEKFYVFNSLDEIYLVFPENKSKFSFYFIQYTRGHFPSHKAVGENAKTKNF